MATSRLVIKAGQGDAHYWASVWEYRELFYFLGWRDFLVRYKQTVLGIGWAVLRPALTMVVFTVVFGFIAEMPSEGVPYPVLVFAGLLPWQFFSNALTEASNSLINNVNLISKVFFPRIIVPVSSILVTLVDFAISFAIMAALMLWYGFQPSWRIVLLPALIVLPVALATGLGLWFAALNVKFRDFRYVVPFVVQLGTYVSPVGFSSHVVPEPWGVLYALNPMVVTIDLFRWSIVGTALPSVWEALVGLAVTGVLSVLGIRYFRRTEQSFADAI